MQLRFSTTVLQSTHGIAASQWIFWAPKGPNANAIDAVRTADWIVAAGSRIV